jgi:hypothetical protein
MFLHFEEGLIFMARFLHPMNSFTFRKFGRHAHALSWGCGIFLGCWIFRFAGSDLPAWMLQASEEPLSMVGLLSAALLALLFSATAVYFSLPGLLLVIAFWKAFLIGWFSCGIYAAFGSAGWLVCQLFMFTDLCSGVLLYAYGSRFITGNRQYFPAFSCLFAVFGCLIAAVDYSFVAPLLRGALL